LIYLPDFIFNLFVVCGPRWQQQLVKVVSQRFRQTVVSFQNQRAAFPPDSRQPTAVRPSVQPISINIDNFNVRLIMLVIVVVLLVLTGALSTVQIIANQSESKPKERGRECESVRSWEHVIWSSAWSLIFSQCQLLFIKPGFSAASPRIPLTVSILPLLCYSLCSLCTP